MRIIFAVRARLLALGLASLAAVLPLPPLPRPLFLNPPLRLPPLPRPLLPLFLHPLPHHPSSGALPPRSRYAALDDSGCVVPWNVSCQKKGIGKPTSAVALCLAFFTLGSCQRRVVRGHPIGYYNVYK